MGREDRIYEEAAALWREMFSEPPPAQADGATLLEMITTRTPDAGYDRIRTPHLRPTAIVMPR